MYCLWIKKCTSTHVRRTIKFVWCPQKTLTKKFLLLDALSVHHLTFPICNYNLLFPLHCILTTAKIVTSIKLVITLGKQYNHTCHITFVDLWDSEL